MRSSGELMPRPQTPCRFPRCAKTTIRKSGYCLTHEKQTSKSYEATRETAVQRGYTGRWNRARKAYLNGNPLCVLCLSEGRTTGANVVDHIKPHKGDQDLFWDEDNWQAVCDLCHRQKSVREDKIFNGSKVYKASYSGRFAQR